MRLTPKHLRPLQKKVVHTLIGLIICWGLVLVLAQIKPFWTDEWRLLYNLKFKSAASLFGPLDFTQQFPRVYLVLIKWFAAPFDYSYFTLRFPAFLTGVCSIVLAYRLMNRIYGTDRPERYLFLLMIISSPVFLKYLVQIKQYEMELFLSLVAIHQLMRIAEIGNGEPQRLRRYAGLCLSFLVAPFFSYTYPIAVAPVFVIVFLQLYGAWRNGVSRADLKRHFALQSFPLLLCAASIVTFYLTDVSQVLKDTGMSCFWQDRMMAGRSDRLLAFSRNIWDFFGAPGSGGFYRMIFSLLGLCGFLYALAKSRRIFPAGNTREAVAVLYAALLVTLVLLLFAVGKLPLGEARLSAFTFPAIALLILHLLPAIRRFRTVNMATGIYALLFLGLSGNVLATLVQTFTDQHYAKAVRIYSHTEDAIIYAQAHRLPIVVSPEVGYPNDIATAVPCLETMDAASVLKTFPAYKERYNIPVFSASDATLKEPRSLPGGITQGVVGDGTNYKIVR